MLQWRSCRQVSHDARAPGNRSFVEKFALAMGDTKVTKTCVFQLKWLNFSPRGSAPHPAGANAPDPVFTVAAIPGAHTGSMTAPTTQSAHFAPKSTAERPTMPAIYTLVLRCVTLPLSCIDAVSRLGVRKHPNIRIPVAAASSFFYTCHADIHALGPLGVWQCGCNEARCASAAVVCQGFVVASHLAKPLAAA